MEGTDGTGQALSEQVGDGGVVPCEEMEVVNDRGDHGLPGGHVESGLQGTGREEGRPLRVAVCGATGYLGKFVCKIAKARGFYVRALVRAKGRLEDSEEYCDEVFVGQATQAESIQGLCDNMDVIFSSVGIRNATRSPTVWEVDYQANINLIDEAVKAGVKHCVFVSILDGEKHRNTVGHVVEARERVVDHLKVLEKAGKLTFTILRPTGFFNDMAELFSMAREGQAWMVGDGSKKINPIHGYDLGSLAVDVIASYEEHLGEHIPVGGPDTFTFKELTQLALRVAERPANTKISSVPVWMLNLASKLATPVNKNLAGFIRFFTMMAKVDMAAPEYGTHHIEDFFRRVHVGQVLNEEGWYEVDVHARGKVTLTFEVTEKDFGREFMWTFRSKRKDIALEAKFVDADTGEEIVLTPPTIFLRSFRKDLSHRVPIDRKGTFYVTLDNEYSMFYKKHVSYWLRVV